MVEKGRVEHDTMGPVQIPESALWGAQTQRALINFKISGVRFPREFIESLGLIKWCCAHANMESGLLERQIVQWIAASCEEVIEGKLDDHFPLDIFQTGSGTSTNMNANEVIANRAIQLAGGKIGSRTPVHPNDHVNMSQSSNDVFPTAIHVSAVLSIRRSLTPSLKYLEELLRRKASEFDPILKTGRTHLQDAVPIRLGQEFNAYATQIRYAAERLDRGMDHLLEVPLGGTAVGTGLNRLPDFPARVLRHLNARTGESFREALDHIEANASRDAVVDISGILKTIAVGMSKIANDIRWLGSGPRNGLGELKLPAVQPGSSIMPGKVNPVIPEAVLMGAAQVIANDLATTLSGLAGVFEINTMMPLMAYRLLESIRLLSNAGRILAEKCIRDLEADRSRCQSAIENSLALATALAPQIGYDRAAAISKKAYLTGKTIRQIAQEEKILTPDQLDSLLDARRMTEPGLIQG